jgi:hypothetical protein
MAVNFDNWAQNGELLVVFLNVCKTPKKFNSGVPLLAWAPSCITTDILP